MALEDMKALFDKFDKDKNGTLDRKELMAGFANVFGTYRELDEMISQYDSNNDAKISFDEFITMMTPTEKEEVSMPLTRIRSRSLC